MLKGNIIDLSKLLNYFDLLSKSIDRIYPEKLTWENINNQVIDLGIKHPKWVEVHFPLILIYHKDKAGELRQSKNIEVMYQNNHNVLTQLVWTAGCFGIFHRKNSHKGFSNIVGAVRGTMANANHFYMDRQKPKKYKNFIEFMYLHDPDNIHIKALCEVLSENYSCNSTGQLRLL